MIVEVLAKLGFDWKVALANLVNFLIIYFLLKNVVFKKLGKAIKDRQEKVQKGIDDAKRAEAALMVAESEKESIIKNAHKDSQKIIEEADKNGKKIISDAKVLANDEADGIRKDAKERAEKESYEMEKKLKREFVSLVVDSAFKTSKEVMDKKSAEKFAEKLIR